MPQHSLAESRFQNPDYSTPLNKKEILPSNEKNQEESPITGQLISAPATRIIDAPLKRNAFKQEKNDSLKKLPKDDTAYRSFRRICDHLAQELNNIDDFLIKDEITDEGFEVVVEVEHLLEDLYDCPWGENECLKRTVVAIQSQVNNIHWTRQHVDFLKDIVSYLRVRYLIDEATVNACYNMLAARGLDPFRGTVSEPKVVKKYRIDEVKEA
jgi:hypothetical protein